MKKQSIAVLGNTLLPSYSRKRIAIAITLFLLFFGFNSTVVNAQLASCQNKFFGNIWYDGNMPINYDQYFNQVTPENATKWSAVQGGGANSWNWGPALDIYNYCKSRGIPFKFHTLVWGNQYPTWVDDITPYSDKAVAVENWIREASYTFPDCDFIDVVNECLVDHAQPDWRWDIGGDNGLYGTGWDWVVWSFEKARQYFPNAKLLINDYNILNNGWNNDLDVLCQIVNILNSRGLIDGIGLQSHGLANVSGADVSSRLNSITSQCPGVPIYISELDIDLADDWAQRDKLAELFPLFWENPAVVGVTYWGYAQGHTWIPNSHLLRSDGSERPAMGWLRDYLGDCPDGGDTGNPIGCSGNTSLANGIYTISARHSGKNLDVYNFSTEDGGNIVQWSPSDGENQQWIVEQSGGVYSFRSVYSDKCLDVTNFSTADGGNIQQWACSGNAAQQFCLSDQGGGYYSITNFNSGKCFDIADISTADGANLTQYSCWGGDNQQFLFTPVDGGNSGGGSGSSLVNNGIYEIEFQTDANKVIDLDYGTDANGTIIHPWDRLGGTAQQWVAIDAGNGYWRFQSNASSAGRVIDLENGDATNGMSIRLWDNYNNNAQTWLVTDEGNGYNSIKSAVNTSKGWDVSNCNMDGSAHLHIWDYYGTSCQLFKFNYVGLKSLNIGDPSTTFDSTFKIYPNPSNNGEFNINVSDTFEGVYSLSIFSLDGKKVYEIENLSSKINQISTGLDKGLYHVKIGLGTKTITQKLVIQ